MMPLILAATLVLLLASMTPKPGLAILVITLIGALLWGVAPVVQAMLP